MKKAYIFLANGTEECEALVIHDLLVRAEINSILVSTEESLEIEAMHGFNYIANIKLEEVKDDYDLLFIPGGLKGVNSFKENKKLKELILKAHKNNKLIGAICAGPSLLADTLELVEDNEFSCYPNCSVKKPSENGVTLTRNIVTGKGLGVAIKLAHKIIEILISKEKADSVLGAIQYEL